MINEITSGPALAEKCRRALGSLHCELPPREKRVLEEMIRHSFDLGQDGAMFGSSDQLALLADVHKTDVSHALSSLRRNRLIRQERANVLFHFRRPMLYFIDPAALVRVAQKPALGRGAEFIERLRAETARWLAHANRSYPLQPDLFPPDPRELDLALAEISRASVLSETFPQNGEPKPVSAPGHGEVHPPESEMRLGPTLLSSVPPVPPSPASPSEGHLPPGARLDPDRVRIGQELGLTAHEIGRLAGQAHPHTVRETPADAGPDPGPVGNSPTTSPPSWKNSNYSGARVSDVSDDKDGEKDLSIRKSGGDARGSVGEFPTGPVGQPYLIRVATLLADGGEPWQPPSRSQETFEELLGCMGAAAMGNYGSWWRSLCFDPVTRRDVLETVATWKLSRTHPRHKPWHGGAWRREFFRRQNARLAEATEVHL